MRIKRMTSDVGQKLARAAVWMMGLGAILAIWGGVWLAYLYRNPPDGEALVFLAAGLFLSGLDLGIIGLASGRIARIAREPAAEAAPEPDRIAVAAPAPVEGRRD